MCVDLKVLLSEASRIVKAFSMRSQTGYGRKVKVQYRHTHIFIMYVWTFKQGRLYSFR